jgi:molybdopterin biosynthesis enzyme
MIGSPRNAQRIERLTPLADVLDRIACLVEPVASREVLIDAAIGYVLAKDVIATAGKPGVALALRDGWAVRAEETLDADSYAPASLATAPLEVAAGQALPRDSDAVAAVDVVAFRGAAAEALAPVAPGEGVLPADIDTKAGQLLRRGGDRVRAVDAAVLRSIGIAHVSVRQPRLGVVCVRHADAVLDAAGALICNVAKIDGAIALAYEGSSSRADYLHAALIAPDVDAVIVIGGTGTGHDDHSVETLARVGRVEVHGIGIAPGETAAVGVIGKRPVLLVPGRLDAALAVYLTVGRAIIGRLAGRRDESPLVTATLTRKVTSTVGLADVVLVRRVDHGVEPLASFYLPHSALTRADGFILIPADSEGFSAGTSVAIRSLP